MNRRTRLDLVRRYFPLFASLTLLVSVSLSAAEVEAIDEELLTGILTESLEEMNAPGLRAAVRFADGRIVRAAVGLADREAGTPLDNSVGMPGGSTGKTFVAALTLMLVEDGVLSLDDPVSKWLGDERWFRRLANSETMKVRHLLSHSAGVRDYPEMRRYWTWSIWRAIMRGGIKFTPRELIGFVLNKKPLFPVGEGYAYTDVGYLVLGKVIESATERTYYDLVQERILDPLKLDEVRPQNASVLTDVTPGYMRGARNLRKDGTMKIDPSSEWTGGGLVTNPTMLVRFYSALANGEVVKPETFNLMKDSGWRNPNTPEGHYGFGLFVSDGGQTIEHGGMWPGYRTHVHHSLNSGITDRRTDEPRRSDQYGAVGRSDFRRDLRLLTLSRSGGPLVGDRPSPDCAVSSQ